MIDRLRSQAVPAIAQGIFTDRMDIVAVVSGQDEIGGATEEEPTIDYASVPVDYVAENTSGDRVIVGDSQEMKQRYVLRFPAYHEGDPIYLDESVHRFVVAARGTVPEKTFVIHKVRDHAGGMWTVIGEMA